MGSINAHNTQDAVAAYRKGYQPIPIRNGGKNPHVSAWTHVTWKSEEEVAAAFDTWREEGASGVGIVLGTPSADLVDIDLDHHRAARLRDYFLPPTAMKSGRSGRPMSHYWYQTTDHLPSTRRYKMPDGAVSVELRSTGCQTVIPGSYHPTGERYRWEGEPFGGDIGPLKVHGKVLAVQVALLAMGCVVVDEWPKQGGRHDAYLALAGGLLRYGGGVHPYWEKNLPVLIRALAQATHDDDSPDSRVSEVMNSTIAKLRAGNPAVGFPRLAEIIGTDHAEMVRRMAREVESLSGHTPSNAVTGVGREARDLAAEMDEAERLVSTLPPEDRDPLSERLGTWQPVDMDPYLMGEVRVPEPTILRRADGLGLFYDGRVNSLYGQSEAAKSWVAMIACQQEMALGERVMYVDLEDEPTFTLSRMKALGIGDDDIRHLFTYVRPEDPHKDMQRSRWGDSSETDVGRLNAELFTAALDKLDPSLIIVDGMTVLYGLHGLDSNDAVSTDIITTWLKRLCRNGRSTVIVIDHTGKGAMRGASPIGAHHKIAMVQGTAMQVHPVSQPMRGALGEVELIVYKDRPGAVRMISTRKAPCVAATVVLDSRSEGVTHVSILPPDPDDVVMGDDDAQMSKAVEKAEKLKAEREAAEQYAQMGVELVAVTPVGHDQRVSRQDLLRLLTDAVPDHGLDDRTFADLLLTLVHDGTVIKHSNNRWARYSRPDNAGEGE